MKRKLGIALRQRKQQEKTYDLRRILHGAVDRAARDGHAYSVVAFIPQHLPGEDISPVVKASEDHVRALVRGDDVGGLIADDVLAVGLFDADSTTARVAAHRIQSDLSMKAHAVWPSAWESGFACYPEDGMTADELIASAIEAARTRRRRLTDWQPGRMAFLPRPEF